MKNAHHGPHHGGHGHQHGHHESHDHKLATFSERVGAFSIDVLLFVGLAYGSLALLFTQYTIWANPHERLWLALWAALFLAYQAFFSAEGRVSLGKRLLGLRVADVEGHPLELGHSMIRSLLYLASSVLDLGFLWALFNPARQCWHDMAVGSVVLAKKSHRGARMALVQGFAVLCLALYGGTVYWHYVASARYHRLMDVSYARVGASEVQTLQELYYMDHGRYADSLEQLAPLSGQPKQFLRDMNTLFDNKQGVRLVVGKTGYKFQAHANDEYKTLVAFAGP